MNVHVDILGGGRDLVLLHGWGLNADVWSEVVPLLAARMRVFAVDLPGHGRSPDPGIDDFDETVDAVAARVPKDAVVCGWSMGGLFAQRLAARHPSRVRGLALVAGTPRFVAGGDWPHGMRGETLERFARDLEADRDATLATFVTLNALHGSRGRAAAREFARRIGARPPATDAALRRGLAWLRRIDLRGDAPRLSMPTLVMHGARDALVPAEAGRWLAGTLPEARHIEWPDAAHLPFFTHRAEFVATLESFVA